MPIVAYKTVRTDQLEELLVSPNEIKTELQIIICNVSTVNDYLYLEVETALGDAPIFWNFPILAFDTYTVPFKIDLGKDEKIKAKSLSGGLAVSIHEKI